MAKIGLIAVIDEVTGYQEIRPKDELHKKLGELTLCPCAACVDWRGDLYHSGERNCFSDMGEGHGKCFDPWNTGCSCTGTGGDGECEACWLWLK